MGYAHVPESRLPADDSLSCVSPEKPWLGRHGDQQILLSIMGFRFDVSKEIRGAGDGT